MHRLGKYSTSVATLLFLACNSHTAQPANTNANKITLLIDSCFTKQNCAGILVVYNDSVADKVYTKGYADAATKMPFNINTIFEAGSITKTFTAYILQAILMEKNISDTTSIVAYLPDTLRQNPSLKHITFLNLLNHTSGLPRLPDNLLIESNNDQPYQNYSQAMLFGYLKNASITKSNKNEYSNLGFALAGILAAHISKQPFETLLHTYLYKALNIEQVEKLLPNNKNKATGYLNCNTIAPYWNMNSMYPAGGIKINAKQMCTYLNQISNPTTKRIDSIVTQLLKPTISLSKKIRVAKAWHTYELPSKPIIYWHNGGTYGFSTFVGFVAGTNKKVVVVINKFNANEAADYIGITILKMLL